MFDKYKKLILAVALVGIGLAAGGIITFMRPEKEAVVIDSNVDHEKIVFDILMIGAGNEGYDIFDKETGTKVFSIEADITPEEIINYYDMYEFEVR